MSPGHGDDQQSQEHDVRDGIPDEAHDGRTPRAVDGRVREDKIEGVDKGQGQYPGKEVSEQSDS